MEFNFYDSGRCCYLFYDLSVEESFYASIGRFLDEVSKPKIQLGFSWVNDSNFSTTSLSTIRLEANASDPDGSLEGVQFFVQNFAEVTNSTNTGIQYAWTGKLDFNGAPAMANC